MPLNMLKSAHTPESCNPGRGGGNCTYTALPIRMTTMGTDAGEPLYAVVKTVELDPSRPIVGVSESEIVGYVQSRISARPVI